MEISARNWKSRTGHSLPRLVGGRRWKGKATPKDGQKTDKGHCPGQRSPKSRTKTRFSMGDKSRGPNKAKHRQRPFLPQKSAQTLTKDDKAHSRPQKKDKGEKPGDKDKKPGDKDKKHGDKDKFPVTKEGQRQKPTFVIFCPRLQDKSSTFFCVDVLPNRPRIRNQRVEISKC